MDDAIARFWGKYISKTVAYDVPERARRWYVKRVELFVQAFPETRLHAISSEDLTGYLKGLGRRSDCQDWQFRQIVDALRILFVDIVKSLWAADFNWQYWMDCSQELPSLNYCWRDADLRYSCSYTAMMALSSCSTCWLSSLLSVRVSSILS